ncbi:Lipid A 3-O-deacylase (PagL) [Lutibacter oricola]|uniref:Lipid A 3-O-deacylase (PagL) n=1 Tax=Lutibacter oricola TaxID=762486 RepID=A0A1H2TWJ9_9FLAO|nr:acyloxyacyl hydrolase [Lutibacter oricola]SDW47544.1 Lipid A 3-O-deacylase (PagL) [Lutibacter oricola]
MKKIFILLFITYCFGYSQNKSSYIQTDYFYGNVLTANADTKAFLEGHPTGYIFSYNKRNFGNEKWHEHYNYPDFGYSFAYQNFHSDILGEVFSVYGHYNFYFFNRKAKNKLILRTGIGLAYANKPYDRVSNNKNIAFGTHLNSSTYFKLYYQRENIFKRIGVNAGLTFLHTSNSNVKSPNAGANIWGVTVGVNYNLDNTNQPIELVPSSEKIKFTQPIKYNLAIRGGINESEIIGTGQKPFFVVSAYADKRINRKSAIQFGADLYISPMLKDYYEVTNQRPNSNLGEVNSFSRIGVFVGHELFLNKLSIETALGYYVKYPFTYENRIYETLSLKRYINDRWFASVRLKAHIANAETVEFGIGVRL